MSDFKNNEQRNAMVLEGIYKGLSGKVDEARDAVSREVQFNSAQQAAAYDALGESIRSQFGSLSQELSFLSQQIGAVYENNHRDVENTQAALIEYIDNKVEETLARFDEMLAERFAAVDEHISAVREELLEALDAGTQAIQEQLTETEELEEEAIDYDVLAEKIASILPETDYDLITDKVVAALPQSDPDVIADKVIAALPSPDEAAIAEKVVEGIAPIDYDVLAERVVNALFTDEPEEEGAEEELTVEAVEEEPEEVEPIVVEVDYERIATRVAELLKENCEEEEPAPEEEGCEEDCCEKLANRVVELLREAGLLVAVVETTEEAPAEEPVEEPAPVEEEPVEEPAPVEEEPAEEPAPVEEEPAPVEEELAAAAEPAVVEEPAPFVEEPASESNLTTRLKRSFTAKIIESEEEIKEFYSTMKNALLSYSKMSSQVNWSNDRFAYNNETIAKIGVRGKTLCVYLALNPEEFPESVYHQKFAGDTKMYERTPLMMKVKSRVAVKRCLRLIELLAERLGAVQEPEFEPVDYVPEFAFRSEEELIREGLIKTGLMEKSDLNF